MNHTAEPWRTGNGGSVVADEPIPGVRGSDDVGYYGGHLVCESVTPANASRIVSCVNGCRALPVKALDDGIVEQLIVLARHAARLDRYSPDWRAVDVAERAESLLIEIDKANG